MNSELTTKEIGRRIYFIQGHRAMLDSDLAALYDVLMSQIVISKADPRGGRQKIPLVFTEQGVAMLSSVLRSKNAVQVNITIMRAFVKLREILETNKDLAKKIDVLESKFLQHDHQFKAVFEAIRQLMAVGSPLTQKRIKGLGSR